MFFTKYFLPLQLTLCGGGQEMFQEALEEGKVRIIVIIIIINNHYCYHNQYYHCYYYWRRVKLGPPPSLNTGNLYNLKIHIKGDRGWLVEGELRRCLCKSLVLRLILRGPLQGAPQYVHPEDPISELTD